MHRLIKTVLNRTPKSGTSRFGMAGGQTSVEFGMVALLFTLMMFAIIDYGWIMFAQMNIQQAVDDAGRYASTGQQTGSTGTRVSSIVGVIQQEIKVPLSSWNLSICSSPPGSTQPPACYTSNNSNPTSGSANDGSAGGPQYTVIIKLQANLAMLTPLNFVGPLFGHNAGMKVFPSGYTFTSSATFRNESFSPTGTD